MKIFCFRFQLLEDLFSSNCTSINLLLKERVQCILCIMLIWKYIMRICASLNNKCAFNKYDSAWRVGKGIKDIEAIKLHLDKSKYWKAGNFNDFKKVNCKYPTSHNNNIWSCWTENMYIGKVLKLSDLLCLSIWYNTPT